MIGDDTIYFKPYDKTYYIASPTQDEHPNVVVKCNPETGKMTSNWKKIYYGRRFNTEQFIQNLWERENLQGINVRL